MKKGFKRITSVVMAAAMAIGLAVTGGGIGGPKEVRAADDELPRIMDAASQVNYSTILGRAMDFGIVANDFTQQGHMETTIAAGQFHNNGSNNDIDFIKGTAQLLFGKADANAIKLGVTTVSNINIELGSTIVNDKIGENDNSTLEYITRANSVVVPSDNGTYQENGTVKYTNVLFNGDFFKVWNNGTPGEQRALDNLVQISATVNSSTKDNISSIVNSIKKKSAQLAIKAGSSDYVLPATYYSANSSKITIDLSSDEFKDRVVYINVDDVSVAPEGETNALSLKTQLAKSEGVLIKKHSSTVVIFNYGKKDTETNSVNNNEDVTIAKIGVEIVDNGNTYIDSSTNSNGKHNKSNGQTSEQVDQEICQKVIYNVRTTGAVDIKDGAGTFLAPYSSNVKNSGGASAGWVVADAMTNEAEWHFIYSGGNQNLLDDGEGEIHFAARKAFTTAWNGENTVSNDTISASAGEYKFEWYETDSSYNTTGLTPITKITEKNTEGQDVEADIANTATSYIKFPKLKFYKDGDNVPAGTNPKYVIGENAPRLLYFVVKEVNAGNTNTSGVENSTGYINIELRVSNDGGTLKYEVKQYSYLGDDSHTLYEKNKDDAYIPMSGPEYKLGAFYNKVNSSLIVKKNVTGDYTPEDGEVYYVTVSKDGKFYNTNGEEVTGAGSVIEVTANGSTSFENLKAGKYTVAEVNDSTHSAERKGYLLTAPSNVTVNVNADNVPTVTLTNDYKATGKLVVKKAITGDNEAANDQKFKFAVQYTGSDDRYKDKYVSTLDTGAVDSDNPVYFDVTAGGDGTVLKFLPGGTYKVVEGTAPDYDTDKYSLTTTYSSESVQIDGDSTDAKEVIITNDYEDKTKVKLVIKKKVVGFEPKNDLTYNVSVYYMDGTTKKAINEAGNVADWDGYTIKVPANGKIEISGPKIIIGRTYYIEEKDVSVGNKAYIEDKNGVNKQRELTGIDISNGSVELTNEELSKTVTITNTYDGTEDDTAKLTVNKVVSPSSIGSKLFNFYVKQTSGGTNTGKYVKVDGNTVSYVDNKADASFDVTSGTPKEITGLEKAKYLVEEDIDNLPVVDGYKWISATATENKSVISAEADLTSGDNSATLKNNYTALSGILVVTKSISGAALDDLDDITFSIKKSDDSAAVDVNGTAVSIPALNKDNVARGATAVGKWVNNPAGSSTYTYTITGLPVGEIYKIKETAGGGTDTYELTSTLEEKTSGAISVSDPQNVRFTNTYKELGSINLTKTIKGLVTEEDLKWLTFTVKDGNTTVWTGTLGDTSKFTKNIDAKGNGTYTATISGLDTSKTYTVTETLYTKDGYDVTVTYKVGDGEKTPGASASVTPTVSGTAVGFENAYTRQKGSISVTKTLQGATKDQLGDIEFKIEGPPDYNNGNAKTISYSDLRFSEADVPVGSYTVTETKNGANETYILKSTKINDVEAKNASISLAKGETATFAFENTYEEQTNPTGSIKLSKKISYGGQVTPASEKAKKFTFKIKLDDTSINGEYGDATFENGVATLDISVNDGEKTISGIPVGTKYKVEETPDNTYNKPNYKINGTLVTDAYATEKKELTDGTDTIEFENKKAYKELTLSKKVEDGNASDNAINFTFTIKLDNTSFNGIGSAGDTISFTNGIATVTLKNGENKTVHLPMGTEYKISEEPYQGFTTTVPSNAEGTLDSDKTVTFTNTKQPVYGSLSVTKKVVDTDAAGHGHNKVYEFAVKCGEQWVQNDTDGTLGEDENWFEVVAGGSPTVINNLDTSKKYTVVEKVVESLNDGYSCSASYNPADEADGGAVNFNTDNKAAVEITNTYSYTEPEPVKSSLTINKTVVTEGDQKDQITYEPTKTFSIAVKHGDKYIQDTNGTEAEGEHYFPVKPGTPLVINNLYAGERYDIIEDKAAAMTDVTPNTTSLMVKGTSSLTIEKNAAENVANIENTYTNPGVPVFPVKISKQAVGGGDELPGAKLCIKKESADGETVDSWISGGSIHEATLPAGKYVIIETVAPSGYEKISSNIEFTIDAAGNVTDVTTSTDVSTSGNIITLFDAYSTINTEVKISKVDATGVESIFGAKLILIKTSGVPAEADREWTSTDDEYKTFDVTEGSYKIVEVTAPSGYKKTDLEVTFDVVREGTALKVKNVKGNPGNYNEATGLISFRNDPIKVSISKVDATNSKEVPGATMVLTKPDGRTEKWTSATSAHVIEGLVAGTYTLEETVAPKGYEKETTKITFTVDEYGSITSVNGPGELGGDGTIKFKNSPIKGTLYVHVTVETPNDTEGIETKDVPGAEVTVTDETGKEIGKYITNEKGEVVDEKTGKYPEVTPGKYTVTITKIPDNYEFKEKLQGKTSKVEVPAGGQGKHEAVIETLLGGLDILITEEPSGRVVPHAKVTVTMPDGTKVECETDDNGMITQFAKKDQFGNYTSPLGEYTYVVTWVPDGYTVTLNKENKGTVTAGNLTSLESKIATKSESKTDKTTTNTKTTTSKKTGDTTPIALVVILMGLSLVAATAIVIKRRKNRA